MQKRIQEIVAGFGVFVLAYKEAEMHKELLHF